VHATGVWIRRDAGQLDLELGLAVARRDSDHAFIIDSVEYARRPVLKRVRPLVGSYVTGTGSSGVISTVFEFSRALWGHENARANKNVPITSR